ncbi:MAG: hypothetical protein ACKOBG_03760 [Actinomycetota bacterium]
MFDPVRICRILNEEGVEYVIVGGFAATIHGSALPTRDIDIVPARSTDNLNRLGRALTRLGAKIRTGAEPVTAPLDGAFLANTTSILNLVTDAGEIDLAFAPAGRAGGFDGWQPGATEEEVSDDIFVMVASLDDVIDSKRTADRPKDRMALPYLEALRDELRRD